MNIPLRGAMCQFFLVPYWEQFGSESSRKVQICADEAISSIIYVNLSTCRMYECYFNDNVDQGMGLAEDPKWDSLIPSAENPPQGRAEDERHQDSLNA